MAVAFLITSRCVVDSTRSGAKARFRAPAAHRFFEAQGSEPASSDRVVHRVRGRGQRRPRAVAAVPERLPDALEEGRHLTIFSLARKTDDVDALLLSSRTRARSFRASGEASGVVRESSLLAAGRVDAAAREGVWSRGGPPKRSRFMKSPDASEIWS